MRGEILSCGRTELPRCQPTIGRHALAGMLAVLMSVASAGAQLDVDRADLYLHGGRLASGAWGCGFAILANQRARDDPHVEWDVSVDQVNNGSQISVGVSAASFTVTHRLRVARAPVAQLSFTIDQDPQPIGVHFDAAADAEGAVHGTLASDDAMRLFAAVGAGSFITLVLDLPDRAADALRFHFVRDSAGPAQGAFAELCRPATAAAH